MSEIQEKKLYKMNKTYIVVRQADEKYVYFKIYRYNKQRENETKSSQSLSKYVV